MIALHYIYIYIYSYISRRILTVKAVVIERGCFAGGAGGWCASTIVYTSFGLLNTSITFSNAHLVLLCYICSDSPMASSISKCWGCLNKANSFCYLCGDFTTVVQRRTNTSLLRTAYFPYFDCKIGDQDESWAPHICCKPCYNGLTAWFNGKKAAFNFAVPMV